MTIAHLRIQQNFDYLIQMNTVKHLKFLIAHLRIQQNFDYLIQMNTVKHLKFLAPKCSSYL